LKPKAMTRVFVDASVLFSAAYSEKGSSREILRKGLRHEIVLVVSGFVIEEARRNLLRKAPPALETFDQLMELLSPEIVADPTLREVEAAGSYINLKDAPVLAAAIGAKVDYLLTLDRKHFIDDPRVGRESGLNIVTPDVLVAIVRGED
jgi:predicted nucleic acid-binding protein